jgi:hypothetical protein
VIEAVLIASKRQGYPMGKSGAQNKIEASSKVATVDPRLTRDAKQKANELFTKIFGDDMVDGDLDGALVVKSIELDEYERVANLLIEMYENSTDRAMKQIHRQEGRILREFLANIEFGVKAEG